ncbi:MAG: type I pullulanase [Candidatus Izemoplasmatales bacterium]
MKKIKLEAYLDDIDLLTVIIAEDLYESEKQISIYYGKKSIDFYKIAQEKHEGNYKLTLKVKYPINLREEWKLTLDESIETEIFSGKVVRTKEFIKANHYKDNDLGVSYHKNHTVFKLWAPLAKKVHLLLESPNGSKEMHSLDYEKNGTWQVKIDKDLETYVYIYNVYVNGGWKKVKDPYAIASKANGDIQYIIDKDKTYEISHQIEKTETPIIYEVSIRDFSADIDIHFDHPKKYLGMIESGLKTKSNHPVGFDYVKELGISHIQLLPVYDFTGVDEENQNKLYNWGYNPSQYFVPEGSYTDKPNHPYKRINDLKKVIDTYHKNGLGIIMDVVYNHVDHFEKFPYEILAPGYSFRLDSSDMMTDFSGCGNDLDTSRPMIKKLMIDSLVHWLKFFNMDGFRFDLMGLIDYNTMNEAYQTLKEIRPDVLIYGEGWRIEDNKSLAHMFNSKVNINIGFFNDQFRDTIKGSTFDTKELGYALGNLEYKNQVNKILEGKGIVNANQSINYVECHDNQTFFDKAIIGLDGQSKVRKHQLVATCLTILAPGIPFIHFGQEFYRSKAFEHNTYNLSDEINQVKWNKLELYMSDVDFIRKIINLRKNMKPYTLKKIEWLESTLKLTLNQFDIFFKVDQKSLLVTKQSPLIIQSSQVNHKNNDYDLNDIGVYIFERK